MKKLIFAFAVFAFVSSTIAMAGEMNKNATLTGWITDSMCASHGVKNCSSKEHLSEGAKLAFVGDDDDKIWIVENPETVADHQGHHVQIKGSTNAKNSTVFVQSLSMLAENDGK